jgi:hypothetical protein
VGKSYYRSADFESERAAMKESGNIATPTSYFGIGILSCFMIADRIEVKTCPSRPDGNQRKPYDVSIMGPGSLFWLKEGTRKNCGTEITLYLNNDIRLHEMKMTEIIGFLQHEFDYQRDYHLGKPILTQKSINPPLSAARTVVWPKYPIICKKQGTKKTFLRIDHDFHFNKLIPLDRKKLIYQLTKWGLNAPELNPKWVFYDWTDPTTGSRIRLATIGLKQKSIWWDEKDYLYIPWHVLRAGLEPQLPGKNRRRILVSSMRVSDLNFMPGRIGLAHKLGSFCWIDLRGPLAPRLKADRKGLTKQQIAGAEQRVKKFFDSICKTLQEQNSSSVESWRAFSSSIVSPLIDKPCIPSDTETILSLMPELQVDMVRKISICNNLLLLERVYKQVCNWLSYDLSSRRFRWPGRRAKHIPS